MFIISGHDRRQFSKLFERLEMFEKGQISLGVLISDIEFLLGALDGVQNNTKQQLRELWEGLEEVYSIGEVTKGGHLNHDDKIFVRDSIKAFRERVVEVFAAAESGGVPD